jgi:hypothetical protein
VRPARGGRAVPRPAAAPLLALALLALIVVACGDTTSQPGWVPSHPDTALLSFQTTAPGVCAITVQYPNDAPAAIGYLGGTYVQVARRAHPASSLGKELGQSGDWSVFLLPGGDLLVVTSGDVFDYRLEASC